MGNIVHVVFFFILSGLLLFPFHMPGQFVSAPPTTGPECSCQAADKDIQKVPYNAGLDFLTLPTRFRVKVKILILTLRVLHSGLSEALHQQQDLEIPHIMGCLLSLVFNSRTKGFWVCCLKLWNSLPLDLCELQTPHRDTGEFSMEQRTGSRWRTERHEETNYTENKHSTERAKLPPKWFQWSGGELQPQP